MTHRKHPIINLFLDAEWYLNQRIFLIGYAYENEHTGNIDVKQIYNRNILKQHIQKMLRFLNGTIYVYGPDVGMIEKRFDVPLRNQYRCVNMLKVVKQFLPGLSSYKLADIEKHLGFHRTAEKYKQHIFDIYEDWHHPEMKKLVLEYNYEDVYYLARIKQILFKQFKPSEEYLSSIALAPKSIWALIAVCFIHFP